jgi:excisionase family DNA binding protein
MEPLVLSIDEAAKALSIGKTKLYAELAAGRIVGTKLGKRTLIKRENLNEYIANLEAYPSANQAV